MEVGAGLVQPVAVARVERAGQPILGVVGHLQPFLEAVHLNDRQYRPKNLFLCESRIRSYIRKHRGLEEVAAVLGLHGLSAGYQPPFLFAGLNVAQHGIQRGLVDHRPHRGVFRGVAHCPLRHLFAHALHKNVIDGGFDNRSRTGRAFLSAEAEGRVHHALYRCVQIGVRAHQDRVFSAHLQDRPLDPDLAGPGLRRLFVNIQSHGL